MTIDHTVLGRIERIYFSGRPHVSFSDKFEGNRVDRDAEIVLFGLRVGPTVGEGGLVHEMSHFVEIDESRCIQKNWGLRARTVQLTPFGTQSVHVSPEHALREARVFAYELNIMKDVGGGWLDGPEDAASSFRHLSAFYTVPGNDEEERLSWCADKIRECMPYCTAERFNSIWSERTSRIPEYFQRQEEFYRPASDGSVLWEKEFSVDGSEQNLTVRLYCWEHGGRRLFETLGFIGGTACVNCSSFFTEEENAMRFIGMTLGGDAPEIVRSASLSI